MRAPSRLAAASAAVAILSAIVPITSLVSHRNLDTNSDRSKPPPMPLFLAGYPLINQLPRWYSFLVPPHLYTLQLSTAFIHSKALYTVTRLGVADRLWDASWHPTAVGCSAGTPRALPIEQLAREVGADEDRLHRVTRVLAGVGIFTQLGQGRFTNNAASGILRKSHPNSVHHVVLVVGGMSYWAHEKMYESVQQGSRAPALELQTGGIQFWAYLSQPGNEGLQELFDRAMVEGSVLFNYGLLHDYPWSRHAGQTVVDVGGGLGGFLSQLLLAQPNITGVLLDSPVVIEHAKQHWQQHHPGMAGRVRFAAGSFFEAVPPGQVFFLGQIIHDWNDEAALDILKAVRRACQKGRERDTALLIADVVMPDAEKSNALVGPIPASLDLQMMSIVDGKERSEGQFRELLQQSGFALDRVWRVRGPHSVVAAHPVHPP